MSKVLATTTEQARRQKFEDGVSSQQMLALRTAEALRKVVLLDNGSEKKTELAEFTKGQVDPQLQLVLIARDHFLEADDSVGKLGFFKAMRDVYLNVDQKTMAFLDMVMRERHHREKLEAFERKSGLAEPSDAEVDAAIGDAP
jgi:hypothetical protein